MDDQMKERITRGAMYSLVQVKPRVLALSSQFNTIANELFPDDDQRREAVIGATLDMAITLLIVEVISKNKGLAKPGYVKIVQDSIAKAMVFGKLGHPGLVESLAEDIDEEIKP